MARHSHLPPAQRVDLVLTGASAQESAAMASGELVGKRVIRIDKLVDFFPGDNRGVRQTAVRRWLAELHPACIVRSGSSVFVWELVPLPTGVTAKAALSRARGRVGRQSARMAPAAFRRFLDLQLGGARRSATSAWRIVRFESRKQGWLWELRPGTARKRMCEFYEDFPELRL